MPLASAVIYTALRRIGHLRPGWTASPEFMADALNEWAVMFDRLGNQRNKQWSNPEYQYTITGAGHATTGNVPVPGNAYYIGPGASDFNGPRPTSIIRMFNVLTASPGNYVRVPIHMLSQEEWDALAVIQIPPISLTTMCWYDPQYSTGQPWGVFNFFPPINGNAIQFSTWGVLQPPATLATVWTAPPGYWDAVIWSLAARLHPQATREIVLRPATLNALRGEASLAWEEIARVNRPVPKIRNDFPSGSKPEGFYDSFVTWTGEPY